MKPPTAGVLAYILKMSSEQVKSAELEHNLYLRQPQVSLAMSYLEGRTWVSCKTVKVERGAQVKIYRLAVPKEKICNDIEKELDCSIDELVKIKEKLRTAMIREKSSDPGESITTNDASV